MPVHIDSVSLCIPSVILSRFYQQNLGVAAHQKNAHSVWRNEHKMPHLKKWGKHLSWHHWHYQRTGSFLVQFHIHRSASKFTVLHQKRSSIAQNEFFLYKVLHIININICNMFIHIDTYNIYIYIYMCVCVYLNICLFYIYYTLCILLLAYKLIFCGSKPQWWALWIDRWIQFKNLQKGRERNFQWNFDVAPSQDASGKWRFS